MTALIHRTNHARLGGPEFHGSSESKAVRGEIISGLCLAILSKSLISEISESFTHGPVVRVIAVVQCYYHDPFQRGSTQKVMWPHCGAGPQHCNTAAWHLHGQSESQLTLPSNKVPAKPEGRTSWLPGRRLGDY